MRSIRYDKRKYPDLPHYRREIQVLGEDEQGLWAFGVRGAPIHRGDEFLFTADWETVVFFPRAAWWNAVFTRVPDGIEIYVDIATPAVITEESVSFIDLDLDVFRSPDGRVSVYDRDEFEERRTSYPPEFVDTAERTTDEIVSALRSMAEPFASAHRRFTDRIEIARPRSASSPRNPTPL